MGAAAVPWITASLMAGSMGVQSAQHDEALRKQNEANREAKKKQEEQIKEMNTPAPQNVDPTTTDVDATRKKRLNQLRAGLMSTIKTKPMGLMPDAGGLKQKLG